MYGQSSYEEDRKPVFAIRTNMLYDAILTPDLSVEMEMMPQWSFLAEGVWAWWSRESDNRYWRIYGTWIEVRRWLGGRPQQRVFTGHHVGVYGSFHTYDFEFGHKGWQSPQTFGVGVSYGYSIRLNNRLNLDFGIRAGYSSGSQIKYIPQCGTHVATHHGMRRYFGITGVEVALVWFPGAGKQNNPESL